MSTRQKNYFIKIILAGSIQILFSLYMIYAVFFSREYKKNYFVVFAVILFCTHLFNSGIQLFKCQNYSRILTISNMFTLALISVGGLFWVGINHCFRFSFWAIILFIALYFIYFFTRQGVKEKFREVRNSGNSGGNSGEIPGTRYLIP